MACRWPGHLSLWNRQGTKAAGMSNRALQSQDLSTQAQGATVGVAAKSGCGEQSAAAGRPQGAKVVVSNDSCRGGVGPPSSSPGSWTPAPAQLLFLAFPVSVLCPDCNYIYQSSLCRVANQCFVCFCTEMYLSTSGKLTFSFHSVKRTFQTAGWAHHQTP